MTGDTVLNSPTLLLEKTALIAGRDHSRTPRRKATKQNAVKDLHAPFAAKFVRLRTMACATTVAPVHKLPHANKAQIATIADPESWISVCWLATTAVPLL
jgi:hypothetical protein